MEVWMQPLSVLITSSQCYHCCTVKPMNSEVWLSLLLLVLTFRVPGFHATSVLQWNLQRAIIWYPYWQPSPSEQPSDHDFKFRLCRSALVYHFFWFSGLVGQLLFGARRTSWEVHSVFHFSDVNVIKNDNIRYRRVFL